MSEELKYCKNCGTVNAPRATSCANCGESLEPKRPWSDQNGLATDTVLGRGRDGSSSSYLSSLSSWWPDSSFADGC